MTTKLRGPTHLMEDESVRLLRSRLPDEWVVRPYHPDYGIDLAIELFRPVRERPGYSAALGEWLFVQVKAAHMLDKHELEVYPRFNVEKGDLTERRDESIVIPVGRHQLETSELATVQAIGAAIPVLLALVDLSEKKVYFVCLNDYVDKILRPSDPDWETKATKTIHVPLANEISGNEDVSLEMLRFYAKRAKLFAAFQKFSYQEHELQKRFNVLLDQRGKPEFGPTFEAYRALLTHFAKTIARYDFWEQETVWEPLRKPKAVLDYLVWASTQWPTPFDRHSFLDLWLSERNPIYQHRKTVITLDDEALRLFWADQHRQGWWQLAHLSRMFEELCREWFLPSYLSELLSR